MKKPIVILNEVYGKDHKSTDVYYPLQTILKAMDKYADQFRQPIVSGAKRKVCHKCSDFGTIDNLDGTISTCPCHY